MTYKDIENLLNSASKHLGEENYQEASEDFKKIIELDSSLIEAHKGLGLAYIKLDKYNEALKEFLTVTESNPKDAVSYFYAGSMYAHMNKTNEARECFEKVIELRPEYIEAYITLGIMFIKTRKIPNAVSIFKKALSIDKNNAKLRYLLGSAYLSGQEFEKAETELKKALKLNYNDPQVYNNLGSICLIKNDKDQALNYFQKAVELNPVSAISYNNIGSLYRLKGDFIKAAEYYEKALEFDPENTSAFADLALLAYKSKKYSEAIKFYNILLKINPSNTEALKNTAMSYMYTGETSQAIEHYEKLIKIKPSISTKYKLALLYTDTGKYEKAMKLYNELLSIKKVSPEIIHDFAILRAKMGEISDSIDNLRKVIALDPNNALAHKDLGVIYLDRRQVDYAREEFEKAYSMAQENPDICAEYGSFHHFTGNFKKAEEFYKKALTNRPHNLKYKLSLGINYISMNKLDDAIDIFKQLLQIMPEDGIVLYNTGKAYFLKKKYEQARKMLEAAYSKHQSFEIANILALAYRETGHLESSCELFEIIFRNHPTSYLSAFELGKTYHLSNNKEKALFYLGKALDIFPSFEDAVILASEIYIKNKEEGRAKQLLADFLSGNESEKATELFNTLQLIQ
jgi:tetratricopeptide (TPR) repeat protein